MEGVAGEPAPLDGDVGRQVAIAAAHPGEEFAFYFGVEVDDLVDAVHAGIRAPRTHGADRLGREGGQTFFKRILHGSTVRLALPAVVAASAVADA